MSDFFAHVAPLHGALDYHLERHNVLATNLAHVDTPGFIPHDLRRVDPTSKFAGVLRVQLKATKSAHFGSAGAGAVTGRVFEDASAGPGPDGNYVSMDREAAKVAANQLRYDTVSAIVSAELRQLAFAAGDGH
ncbi:MAG: flagellar basal body rod protein FlgB [Polyangiaceae bacterium]|nr:flagellar basal body rod protein FlgB [Myxococcales bacterium]MCB9587292.1 flagellar basal body rod protein FlgB [Polyangiaceae bacterium]MCB9605911.1 flagellar basal body rod protein FlgB [Polyangiaceae bacterium]